MNKYIILFLCFTSVQCLRFEKGLFLPASLFFFNSSGVGYTISGTINNLNTPEMIIISGTGQTIEVSAGATNFQFEKVESVGINYIISISNPPKGQSCTITNGSGTISENVTNIKLDCYTSGSFDTTFGNGQGFVQFSNIAGSANVFDVARSFAFEPTTNKIIISGDTSNGTNNDIFVCKLNEDGSADTTFASGGTTPGCAVYNSGFSDIGYAMTVDTSGKIFTVGQMQNPPHYLLVTKFTSAGILDTSFNGTGSVSLNINPAGPDEGRDITVDSSGNVFAAGRSNCQGVNTCFWTVWKYKADGTLDTSFNTVGYLQTAGIYGTAWETIIEPTNKIVTVGSGIGPGPGGFTRFDIRRYNSDGSLDTSFNGTGSNNFLSLPYTNGGSSGVALTTDQNNKYLVTGTVLKTPGAPPTAQVSPFDNDMLLVRFNQDGTLDTSFNGIGYVTDSNAAGGTLDPIDEGTSVMLDSFGRIVVAGISCNNNGFSTCGSGNYKGYSIVVWRYKSDGSPDTSLNAGSHFKIVDSNFLYQNAYTTKFRARIDHLGRIVIAGGKDIDASGTGDVGEVRVWRLWL